VRMTSVSAETRRGERFAEFQETLARELCTALQRAGRDIAPDALGASVLSPASRSG
jgi:hypothetical protein